MTKTCDLKVLETCKVAPKQTPSNFSLPLTFFDIMWLRFHSSQRLFFYETIADWEIVLAKLKISLSFTLQNYLPLSGNLLWPPHSKTPIVEFCEGDGVSLTVGESTADFHHLSCRPSFHESKEYYHLLPEFPNSETQIPVMSLQVTFFPNKGFCIGYAIHHAVLDGKSLAMYMHSWAFICKSLADSSTALLPELTPSYDRSLIRDPYDLERHYMNVWLGPNDGTRKKSLSIFETNPSDDMMTGTLELQKIKIDNIKKLVYNHLQRKGTSNDTKIHVSSFTVSIAYVWATLVRTQRRTSGETSVDLDDEIYHLVLSVDCRARVDPPLPSTYFGNCITGIIVDASLNDLVGDKGVLIAAEAVGEAIDCFKEGVLKDKEDIFEKIGGFHPGTLTYLGGSNRFDHYKTDFGWGSPRMVKLVSNGKSGAFNVSDSRDGDGGVEVGIVLKKHEVEEFISLFEGGLEG